MTELSRQDAATRLLAIAVLKVRIAEEEKRLRNQLTTGLVTGAREAGVIDATDPETTALGFVSKRKGATTTKVTSPDALLAWVKERLPWEIVTTEAIRSAFLLRLLDAVKKDGGWVDHNGQLHDVPGVQVITGDPTLQVKPSEDAARLVAEALADRRLELLPAEQR